LNVRSSTHAQESLPLGVAPVEDRAHPHERRGGYDEAGRPHESDPLEVRLDRGIERGHRDQFVSGQR